ncbi:MAG: hypothetical protein ACFFD4_05035 [Candidatus Odinarchaeota archaeon]
MFNTRYSSFKLAAGTPPKNIPSSIFRLTPAAAIEAIKHFYDVNKPVKGQILVVTDERGKYFHFDPSSLKIFHSSDKYSNYSLDLLVFEKLVFSIHEWSWNEHYHRFITGKILKQAIFEIIRPPATVRRNTGVNGIEIIFAHEPSGSIRKALKNNGFHYSPKRRLWHAPYNDKLLERANMIVQGY